MNRDAMAAFLFRLDGSPTAYTPPVTSPFVDITPSTKFYREMCYLYDYQISTGTVVDGRRYYEPGKPVKRDAMAAFLYRFALRPTYTPPATSPFADITPSTKFYAEMTWMYANGISTGYLEGGNRYYRPGGAVNRDAMAAFLYRFSSWVYRRGATAASRPQ